MNQHKLFLFLFLVLGQCCFAQTSNIDSLQNVFRIAQSDSAKLKALHELSFAYLYSNTDSSLKLAQREVTIASKSGSVNDEIRSLNDVGNTFAVMGKYVSALDVQIDALRKAEKIGDEQSQALCFTNIGETYRYIGDYTQATKYALRSLAIDLAHHDTLFILYDYLNLGDYYLGNNKVDSALVYENKAYQLNLQINRIDLMEGIYSQLGNIHAQLGNDDLAFIYYKKAVGVDPATGNNSFLSKTYSGIAKLFQRANKPDSALQYSRLAFFAGEKALAPDVVFTASAMLANLYEKKNNDSALKYLKLSVVLKDSILSQEKLKQMQNLTFAELQRQQEIEAEKIKAETTRSTNIQYIAIALGIITFIILFLILSRSVIVTARSISFFGVLGLLVVFEFINLLIHPSLSSVTDESPVLMLLALVIIASLLIPMHHWL